MSASVRCGIEGCHHVALDVFGETPLCATCIAYMASMNSENEAALHDLLERHFSRCPWCRYLNQRGVLVCAHCGWIVDRITSGSGVVGLVNGNGGSMGTCDGAP